MTNKSDKVLVVFSTLNQITNYIAYKITQPQKVICITYDENVHEGANIHTTKWNENLSRELEKEPRIEVVTHSITEDDIKQLENSSSSFFDNIFPNYQEDKQTYFWHITGGQRIFSLKAYEFISKNNRLEQDALFYIEGNHNKLMFMGNNKTHEEEIRKRYNEADFNLTIDTCFRLMGFKEVEGKVLKRHGDENKSNKEHEFYNSLIGHIDKEAKSKEDHHFLKKLSESNDAKEKRRELITGYVEEIVNLEPIEEDIAEYCCFNYSYPAGYMFEKLVGYKLFNKIKDNPNIIEMQMGIKIKANIGGELKIIDEIDILLLTKYGKLINIECKSGAMSGDNAKSTHYTTYALAGVFGVPILMSPSFHDEINRLDKVKKAIKAGERANLQVVHFDEITEETLNQWF
ncbi:hypothetical protein ACR6HW_08805 [Fusibacter sp. JL298sf-3]